MGSERGGEAGIALVLAGVGGVGFTTYRSKSAKEPRSARVVRSVGTLYAGMSNDESDDCVSCDGARALLIPLALRGGGKDDSAGTPTPDADDPHRSAPLSSSYGACDAIRSPPRQYDVPGATELEPRYRTARHLRRPALGRQAVQRNQTRV